MVGHIESIQPGSCSENEMSAGGVSVHACRDEQGIDRFCSHMVVDNLIMSTSKLPQTRDNTRDLERASNESRLQLRQILSSHCFYSGQEEFDSKV